jgi:hypothetical protein
MYSSRLFVQEIGENVVDSTNIEIINISEFDLEGKFSFYSIYVVDIALVDYTLNIPFYSKTNELSNTKFRYVILNYLNSDFTKLLGFSTIDFYLLERNRSEKELKGLVNAIGNCLYDKNILNLKQTIAFKFSLNNKRKYYPKMLNFPVNVISTIIGDRAHSSLLIKSGLPLN